MNITQVSIRRPVMTSLVMLAIVLFGVVAYRELPVSDLPNVDFPTINVSASLPGASPETMASAVATPLEREFSTISGLDSMTSSSSQGNTNITLQFNLSRDIDAAAQDVQAAIAKTARRLPDGMPSPPTYSKSNPADSPILLIALTSQTLAMSELDEYGQTLLSPRISTIPGVAQVQVYGSQKYAVRIQLDPHELASRQIGIDEVAQAVQNANVNLPTGTLSGPRRALTIEASGQLMRAQEFRSLIVKIPPGGAAVRLGDLGQVTDSVENDRVAAWYVTEQGARRSVMLAVQRQPGTNTIEVARRVRELLPTFREQLPASVELNVLIDQSQTIQASFNDVRFTLVLTLGLVVLVIFLFLRNFWATTIPSLTLPMALVGTFAVMYLLGFSLDNLSLMALTLSVGFVVDDAVVMLENIVRHTEMGKGVFQAALDGSREIGFTIVSMTLSLAAVFIPVLFMSGLVGRLFREFAVTIGVAVLVSGLVSLMLTPMLASRLLRRPGEIRHGRLYRASEAIFNGMLAAYGWSLRRVLRHRVATMLVALATLAGSVWLFQHLPQTFLPSEDRDLLRVSTEARQGTSFDSMNEHQRAVTEILRKDPNVQAFMSSVGGMGRGGTNTGNMFVRLKPRNERSLSADQVAQSLRGKLNSVPGIQVVPVNPPSINVGGRGSRSQYQFTLQDPDIRELYLYAQKLQDAMGQLPGLQDVNSDLQIQNPQVAMQINRDAAADKGISAAEIEDALYYAYGQRQISSILASNNDYNVILELLPQYQRDPEALSMLYVRSSRGQLVPLRAVTTTREDVGPLSVNHSGQLPSVTISFNLAPGVALGDAVQAVRELARQTLPDTVTTGFSGTAQAFETSMRSMQWLLLMAVVVIYIVLGILYESFLHPLTILSALPLAGFGALATLAIFHEHLSLYAFVGIIMLVGLVKKNGIMMVDFALDAQRNEGKPAREAIYEACMVRFRPIMMTTMAALMAALPIALGYGAGAETRRPLGLAVVGGLVVSQTLTLFVTPVVYTYIEALRNLGRRRAGKRVLPEPDLSAVQAK